MESGPGAAVFNMALDEALLEAMPRLRRPALRFYGWTEPAASFGYFQKHGEVERLTLLRPLIRRPTGGGVVPHDHDWTYSVAIPVENAWYEVTAIESYRRVHEWIQRAFERLGVMTELAGEARRTGPGQCFAGHEKHDLLWQGRKIAGAAQRRTRRGLLIQGSVQSPQSGLRRAEWERAMLECGPGEEMGWEKFREDAPLQDHVARLIAQKYGREEYVRRR
jgi:lipoate-protein ligase A